MIKLGKLIHQKNKEKIEKSKIRINRPGSETNPKLSEAEQIVLMLVYLRHNLRDYELIVDSAEQPIERPSDYQEQKRYYSGKQKRHTLKS